MGPDYDYPNPTLRRDFKYLGAHLRFEPQPRNGTLLKAQDKQFAGPGDWQTYDYPNPQGKKRSIDSLTWTVSGNALTAPAVVPSPFNQDDWPIPGGYKRTDYTWVESGNSLTAPTGNFMPPMSWTTELVRRIQTRIDNPPNLLGNTLGCLLYTSDAADE